MLLEVESLVAGYGPKTVLHEVCVRIPESGIVTVLGPNGAGKTSLVRAISGELRIMSGTVRLDGTRIDRWPVHRIARGGVVQVPEGRQVFPDLTVEENLLCGSMAVRDHQKTRRADLDQVLTYFPALRSRLRQPAGTLSGGEQQMLAVGRALVAHARVLLLDEPSLGLAPAIVQQIFEILREINRTGVALLLVEQNVTLALALADYGYILQSGQVVMEGATSVLRADPAVKGAYQLL